MTIRELLGSNLFEVLNSGSNLDQEISKPFCCDLLSVAMSKAPMNSAWVTVMGNMNTLAVGTLAEVACIILAEGAVLDSAALEKAKMQNITILRTDMPAFEASLAVYRLVHG